MAIKNVLRKLFRKRMQLEDFFVDRDMSNLEAPISDACQMLHIDRPDICLIPYMYDTDVQTIISDRPNPSVPKDRYNGGYCDTDNNRILLACFNPQTEEAFSDSVLLETVLHELRHLYQYKYEPKYYANGNAVGNLAHIDDESEIDADAFSAYFLSYRLGYMQHVAETLFLWSQVDGGRRVNRVKELVLKYGRGEMVTS